MSELRVCPFCGGQAEMYRTKHTPIGWDFTPRCKKKSCCGRLSKKFTSEAVAEAFWDRRKPIDRMVERLEAIADEAQDQMNDVSVYSYYDGYGDCAYYAIGIIKEEGGLIEED